MITSLSRQIPYFVVNCGTNIRRQMKRKEDTRQREHRHVGNRAIILHDSNSFCQ